MIPARRCTATNRKGEQCRKAPIPGATVCTAHGGRSPQVIAAARRRLALVEAEREVAQLAAATGPLTLSDVYRELLHTGALAIAWRDTLAATVHRMAEYGTGEDGNLIRADVALYERALDRTARVLELVARLDLDSRLVALTVRQGEQLADVLRGALGAADVTPAQEAAAWAALPRLLRRAGGVL